MAASKFRGDGIDAGGQKVTNAAAATAPTDLTTALGTVVSITAPTTQQIGTYTVVDDGSATGDWIDRLQFVFDPVTGTTHPTFWLNEYCEFRGIPAKSNTVAGRFFAAVDATDLAARNMTVPVFEVTDQRDGTRTTMFAVYGDGDVLMTGDVQIDGALTVGGVPIDGSGGSSDPFAISEPEWIVAPVPNATTTPSVVGCGLTAVGTATASGLVAATNAQTKTPHLKYRVTTAAATAIASLRQNTYAMGPIRSDGYGGFKCSQVAGPDTGTSTATGRFFLGLASSASAPTDVEPSTLLNCIMLAWDAADTNVQIMHNDGASTCTKINTGWAVPTADSTEMFKFETYSLPTAGTVVYRATRLSDKAQVTGTINSNMPGTTTYLAARAYHSVGGTSSVVGLAIGPARGMYRLEA